MKAAEIRVFELGIIPGLLQTPEYAAAIAEGAVSRGAISLQQAEERLSLLVRRQDALDRSPAPIVYVVLDESCIRRPVGEAEVWDAQLRSLAEFARQPDTVLQIAPYALGARRAFDLPVNLLVLPDGSRLAYAESAAQANLTRDSQDVQAMMRAYHHLQTEALSQTASVAMITEARRGTP